MDDRDCKACATTVHVSDSEIDDLIGQLKLKQNERASCEEYRTRIAACGVCKNLAYGTTCMQSGCLVRVRALMASGRCPDPSGNRWNKIS